MSYLQNGDFESGEFPPDWGVQGTPRVYDGVAELKAGDKINQNFKTSTPGPSSLFVEMELFVEGGSGPATGDVQVVFVFQTEAGSPISQTFNVPEPDNLQRLQIRLNLPSKPTSGFVEFLVQQRVTKVLKLDSVLLEDGADHPDVATTGFQSA